MLSLGAQNRQISWLPLKLCVQMLFLPQEPEYSSLSLSLLFLVLFFKFQGNIVHFLLLRKWLAMKNQDNTFKDLPLNHDFAIRNAICNFFPYPITKTSAGVKRSEKVHLGHHHRPLKPHLNRQGLCLGSQGEGNPTEAGRRGRDTTSPAQGLSQKKTPNLGLLPEE